MHLTTPRIKRLKKHKDNSNQENVRQNQAE